MSVTASSFFDWFRGPKVRREGPSLSDVERADDKLKTATADLTRATFDHADSAEYVRTTVEAVLDQMERRGIRDGS